MNAPLGYLSSSIFVALLTCMGGLTSVHAGDRVPLIGDDPITPKGPAVFTSVSGSIVSIDPNLVPCLNMVAFSGLDVGASPGTSYDGALTVDFLSFGERFAGQSVVAAGVFDSIQGVPSEPLEILSGDPGQNLYVFDYSGNVLAGLGMLGFSDIDAIGEGSIAIYFPMPQERVKLALVGGNGGSAILSFYRRNGTLIDDMFITQLTDLSHGFATLDEGDAIAGIVIQNRDASGIGLSEICYDPFPTSVLRTTWGSLKQIYR